MLVIFDIQSIIYQQYIAFMEIEGGMKKDERLIAIADIVLKLLTGLFAFVAFYLSFRRTKAVESQVRIASESKEIEQFSRAVDQLGSMSTETKLGAIYAFHRMAKVIKQKYGIGSEEFQEVVDILCAFIRSQAATMNTDQESDIGISTAIKILSQDLYSQSEKDLSYVEFENYILPKKMTFVNFSFENSNLSNAKFENCSIEKCSFVNSNLENTNITQCTVFRSVFNQSDMENTSFLGSRIADSKFIDIRNFSIESFQDTEKLFNTYSDDIKSLLESPESAGA